ncbi:MAG: hypothetical protein EOP04_25870 [Proteobacteria bacterium]|nr:MAG: hypothetical protein EOP04_25870 [Pseudomonadota bacterium]
MKNLTEFPLILPPLSGASLKDVKVEVIEPSSVELSDGQRIMARNLWDALFAPSDINDADTTRTAMMQAPDVVRSAILLAFLEMLRHQQIDHRHYEHRPNEPKKAARHNPFIGNEFFNRF